MEGFESPNVGYIYSASAQGLLPSPVADTKEGRSKINYKLLGD